MIRKVTTFAILIVGVNLHADPDASATAAEFLGALEAAQGLHEAVEDEARKVEEMGSAVQEIGNEISDLEKQRANLEQTREQIANNVPQIPPQPFNPNANGAGGGGSGSGAGGGGGSGGNFQPMKPAELGEAPQFELPQPLGEAPVGQIPGFTQNEERGMGFGPMPKNNFQMPQFALPQNGQGPGFDPGSIAQNGMPTLMGASSTGSPIGQNPDSFLNQGGAPAGPGGGGGMPGMGGMGGGAGGGGADGGDVMGSVGNEQVPDTASGITTTSLAVGEGSGGAGEGAASGSNEIITDPDESPVKAQRSAAAALLKGRGIASNPEPQGLMVYGPGFLASTCDNKGLKKLVGVCLGALPGGFTPSRTTLAETENSWPVQAPVVEAGAGAGPYRSRILELVSRGIASEK